LEARYESAKVYLMRLGLGGLMLELEAIANASRPVIAMPCEACDDLLRDGKYRNYYHRVEYRDRDIADETRHADRSSVNDRIYPGYGKHLHYGVMSPDCRGLGNYGPVALRWRVLPHYLQTRATLLEDNEYKFFDDHALAGRGAKVPAGYRAIWEDRSRLAVAKLAPRLNSSTGVAELSGLLMESGADRSSDRFIEVAMYAEDGIDSRDIDQVVLLEPLTDPLAQLRWQIVEETCQRRGIQVVPLS
jgi:hypothetical protein